MSEKILKYSTYLMSKSSFLTGIGQIFDIRGLYCQYNESPTAIEADTKAIFTDWLAVGEDLQIAYDDFVENEVSKV